MRSLSRHTAGIWVPMVCLAGLASAPHATGQEAPPEVARHGAANGADSRVSEVVPIGMLGADHEAAITSPPIQAAPPSMDSPASFAELSEVGTHVLAAGPSVAVPGDGAMLSAEGHAARSVAKAASGAITTCCSDGPVPGAAKLSLRVFPVPANSQVVIRFTLSHTDEAMVSVYSALGQRVAVLQSGRQEPGVHELTWHGIDAQRVQVGSGVYWVVLTTSRQRLTQRIVYLR
jgi:hypothetical protein